MIDPSTEHLISLRGAARLLPPRPNGKTFSLATVYRWTLRGCRGVHLECLQAGGTRVTSTEAVARFLLALSTTHATPQLPIIASPKSRPNAAARRAAAELDDAGI